MRVLIVTDAWHPQINGVVRSLSRMVEEGRRLGHEVDVLGPDQFRTIPCPTYPEIRLAVTLGRQVSAAIAAYRPSSIHIATEGPLGFWARRYCQTHNLAFTTSYHTRFPEYIAARVPVPERWTYAYLRWFHNAGAGCMVSTPTMVRELAAHGFDNLMLWERGVNAELFRPQEERVLRYPGPVFLYVGRVSVEKNISAFLDLDLPGTKVVVGDGPERARLAADYPNVAFLGVQEGQALADIYASADVFVFPSLTDTYGIVLLEALASGVPVAAYPVAGPVDVLGNSNVGVLDEDLQTAVLAAMDIPREACRAFALRHSWADCGKQFFDNIQSVCPDQDRALQAAE